MKKRKPRAASQNGGTHIKLPGRFSHWRNSFWARMFFMISVLLTVVMICLGVGFYYISRSSILDMATNNLSALMEEGRFRLNEYVTAIRDSARNLLLDSDLYKIIAEGEPDRAYALYQQDTVVKRVLQRHFSSFDKIYAANIITDYYVFGENTVYFPLEDTLRSDLYKAAREGAGKLVFFPSFEYNDMFSQPKQIQFPYPRMFAAVQALNLHNLNPYAPLTSTTALPEHIAPPVLVLYFEEAFLSSLFQAALSFQGTDLLIANASGKLFYQAQGESDGRWPQLEDQFGRVGWKSGSYVFGDKLYIIRTIGKIGWFAVASCPLSTLLAKTHGMMRLLIPLLLAMLLATAIASFHFARRIAAPLRQLTEVMRINTEGDFRQLVTVEGSNETRALAQAYNRLTVQIDRLIDESVSAGLRQKNLELMTLHLQMEPHFLYNTLNTISWMALNEGSEDIHTVTSMLARMLRYTLHHKSEFSSFRDDWRWMLDYFALLRYRISDRIAICYSVQEPLHDVRVPMLFLQPFVENAVLHGLNDSMEGGRIEIDCRLFGGRCHCEIRDNGKGMTEAEIDRILSKDMQRIGITNVDKRIKMIYGEAYGVRIASGFGKGTCVTIEFPAERYESMIAEVE